MTTDGVAQFRLEAWIDGLPIADQPRAKLLSELPAQMAVALVDRDMRMEMHLIEQRLVKEIRALAPRPPLSKKGLAALAVVGGTLGQAILAAFNQVWGQR